MEGKSQFDDIKIRKIHKFGIFIHCNRLRDRFEFNVPITESKPKTKQKYVTLVFLITFWLQFVQQTREVLSLLLSKAGKHQNKKEFRLLSKNGKNNQIQRQNNFSKKNWSQISRIAKKCSRTAKKWRWRLRFRRFRILRILDSHFFNGTKQFFDLKIKSFPKIIKSERTQNSSGIDVQKSKSAEKTPF